MGKKCKFCAHEAIEQSDFCGFCGTCEKCGEQTHAMVQLRSSVDEDDGNSNRIRLCKKHYDEVVNFVSEMQKTTHA